MAICVECGASYSPKRLELGYRTCLDCGSVHAQREAQRKAKCCAPAYNKGLSVCSDEEQRLGVGRLMGRAKQVHRTATPYHIHRESSIMRLHRHAALNVFIADIS